MSNEIFGTHEEMDRLVNIIKTILDKGVKAVPTKNIKVLKGYGIFVETINNQLTFGVRIRTVAGILNLNQVRVIGELSKRHGNNHVDVTNRMGLQIHYLNVDSLREVLHRILSIGLTSKGGCGDTPRAITTCPVSDIDPNQLFNVIPLIKKVNEYYYRKWEVFGPNAIPRKFKVSITACPSLCSFPEINCVGLIGVIHNGIEGFTVTIGGGLSSTPHIGRHMPVFIEKDDVPIFLEAIVSIWKEDPKYRPRHRSRIKFLVDDYGVERFRDLIEVRMGKRLMTYKHLPKPSRFDDHMGIRKQNNGLYYIGIPIIAGKVSGDDLILLAELIDEYSENGDLRITPQQNFIITNIPYENINKILTRLKEQGIHMKSKWSSVIISDVAAPFCPYSRINTKKLSVSLAEHLDSSINMDDINNKLRIHISGCPRDCGQHWIADIGLQGRMVDGDERYEITVGGGWRRIGRVVFTDIPVDKVKIYIENIIKAYIKMRSHRDEFFDEFCDKYSLNEIAKLMSGEGI